MQACCKIYGGFREKESFHFVPIGRFGRVVQNCEVREPVRVP